MSFVRPQSPPVVRAADLARFVDRLLNIELAHVQGFAVLNIKFGARIDVDDNPTSWDEPVNSVISTMNEIDWDIDVKKGPEIAETLSKLANEANDLIYRAFVMLSLDREVATKLHVADERNTRAWCPGDFGIEIGPILACDLQSDEVPQVGWISIGFSGQGYFYPRTLKEIVGQLESEPKVQQAMEICRETFPVPHAPVEQRVVKLREEFRSIWAYEDFDRPWDWYWWPKETG